MTSLVIDIGNTLIKIAVFKLDEILEVSQYETIDVPVLDALLNKYHPVKAIISSVKKNTEAWQAGLGQKIPLTHFNTLM